ncbi:MAG: hypothetical protein ACRC3Y_06560 [Romboutsia sp.]|uniref:hypothetical protein n=1 Tax=Romboutsia sp. TaxID=1965302 RepID=UPI003F2F0845
MKSISTLKKLDTNDKAIQYLIINNVTTTIWGDSKYSIDNYIYENILDEFFIDNEKWYELSASMTEPKQEGLGAFIVDNELKQINGKKLTSRDASLIGAIMYDLKMIDAKGKSPIKIKKIK